MLQKFKEKIMVQILNIDTIFSKHSKPATIRIAPNGFVRFSSAAVKNLGLTEGMKLEFYLDKEKDDIVFFAENERGIPLRLTNRYKKSPSLQICCRPLPLKLLTHLKIKEAITFRLYPEKVFFNEKQCFVIEKLNKHIPTKWR